MDPHPEDNQPVSFHSSNINKTKSGEKTEYFVQIRDSAESRRKRSDARHQQRLESRKARHQALKAQRKAKSLSRRQYLIEWFKVYRIPIVIIFLSLLAIAVILGLIIVFTWPKDCEDPVSIVEINSNMSVEERESALSQVLTENGAEVAIEECNRLASTLDTPTAQANTYTYCASQLILLSDEAYYPTILDYLYKAEELAPTYETAVDIYTYEYQIGSQEKGDQYYAIAAERASTESATPSETPTEPSEPTQLDLTAAPVVDVSYDVDEDGNIIYYNDYNEEENNEE